VSQPRFCLAIHPVATDIDELDHVSNLVYLRWLLEVAMAHSRACGWDYPEYRALGAVFVVRRHEIDYVAPVVAGQELRAETWVEAWRAASCVRRTELVRVADGQVVCRGATTWAFMSLTTGRPVRIPEEIRGLFIVAT
jgi:acyl-CoA thioester hydrolase